MYSSALICVICGQTALLVPRIKRIQEEVGAPIALRRTRPGIIFTVPLFQSFLYWNFENESALGLSTSIRPVIVLSSSGPLANRRFPDISAISLLPLHEVELSENNLVMLPAAIDGRGSIRACRTPQYGMNRAGYINDNLNGGTSHVIMCAGTIGTQRHAGAWPCASRGL